MRLGSIASRLCPSAASRYKFCRVRNPEPIVAFPRITVNSNQMGGVPCIRGLRIPVATVVGMVADG
ncbi:MAG: DUF433 domain-containing protein, partial [Xanthobacteraceae bacterium]